MTRYELLLFLHIAAATIWLGAALTVQLLALRADRSADPAAMKVTAENAVWLAARVFIPSSLAVLVVGVLLVLDGPWAFDQLWILLGLAGYAASFLVGILYFKPEDERINAAIAASGPGDPEVRQRIARMNAVSRLELTVLFLVLADMALKPTADDVGTLLVGAAILVAAAILTARSFRGGRPSVAEAEGPVASA